MSTKGEGKGFTQKKYEDQILQELLADICKERQALKQRLRAFCTKKDYFVIEDGNRVHEKKDTKKNQGLCNKAQMKCFIYSLD